MIGTLQEIDMTEMMDLLQLSLMVYGAPVLGLIVLVGALGFLPAPTSLLVIAAGVFSRQGSMDWYYAAALGLAGAVLGDSLGFALGRWGGKWVSNRYGNSKVWIKAQSTFDRGSGVAVFITRFLLTALAVPVNLMAGSSKLRFRSFLFYVIAGEAMWIILYGGLGYFFSSQWTLINSLVGDFGGLVLILTAVGFGIYLWRFRKYILLNYQFQFAWIPIKRLK
jgi:membrane protein DedA with SNARE-associated domain